MLVNNDVMDIENLKQWTDKHGNMISSYPQLCSILKIPKLTNNSKKAQINKLKRYCELEVVGRRFVIKCFYETAITKEYPSIYQKYVQKVILDMVASSHIREGNSTVLISKSNLFLRLNVVNDMFAYFNMNREELSDELDVNKVLIDEFYNSMYSKLSNMIDRAFAILESKRLVKRDKVYVTNFGICNEEDTNKIFATEKLALVQLGLGSKYEVVVFKKMNEFNKLTLELLQQTNPNITFYYQAYKIFFVESFIDKYSNQLDEFLSHTEIYNELNSLIRSEHMKSIYKRYEDIVKLVNLYESGDLDESYLKKSEKNRLLFNESYVRDNRKMVERVIESKI